MFMTKIRKKNLISFLIYCGVEGFGWLFMFVYYENAHGLGPTPWLSFIWVPALVPLLLYFILFLTGKSIGTWPSFFLSFGIAWLFVYMACMGIYTLAVKGSSWTWVMLMFAIISFFLFIVTLVIHFSLPHKDAAPKAQ
jgi:drug/metabolite transporter (DMT)-like permease